MRRFKSELLFFIFLFIVSSIIVHNSVWITNPIGHFNALFSHPMPYHPLIYVALIYILFGVIRVVFYLVKKIFTKTTK